MIAFRLALIALFVTASIATAVRACDAECNAGGACSDAEELCLPVGSFSS